ncbi:hypothetical protein EB118_03495 [bacterium]|nr:hypothetical protein [bacterium]NDC94044.1 hypothetical protein [bacterium]NDD82730.1 hypothetical protein [bacterium]NDG29150.1 hypothetical protein [bacterium]
MAADTVKEVITRIQKLSPKEKCHVLKLLKRDKVEFTKNANGYFFDLTNLEEQIVMNIKNCLDSIERNRHQLEQMNTRREELVMYYKKVIHENTQKAQKENQQFYQSRIALIPHPSSITVRVTRRNVVPPDTRDPDDILRDQLKPKFSKDSIFHKIESRMRAQRQRRNAERTRHRDDTDEYYQEKEGSEAEYDGDMNYEGDVNEIDIDIEGDIDVDIEIDQDIDVEGDDIEGDPDIDQSDHEVEGDPEGEIETEVDSQLESQSEDTDIQTHMEMEYYKKVLNKQGYTFDDNKYCYLVYQEYIK